MQDKLLTLFLLVPILYTLYDYICWAWEETGFVTRTLFPKN